MRVAFDVGDERVMRVVDRRELLELGEAQARLRAVEACAPRLVAEALEDREHGANIAAPERSHEELRAVPGFDQAGMHE